MAEQKPEQVGTKAGNNLAMWFSLVAVVILGVGGLVIAFDASVKPEVTVVVAAHDLPAYSRLSASDVTTATLAINDPSDMLTDTAVATGKIVISAVTIGEALSTSMLLDAPQVEPDWWIVTLPLTATVAPAPGETVLLIGVDETGESLSVSDQTVALGMEDAELVVALPPDEGLRAAGYQIGGRQLLVVRVVEP